MFAFFKVFSYSLINEKQLHKRYFLKTLNTNTAHDCTSTSRPFSSLKRSHYIAYHNKSEDDGCAANVKRVSPQKFDGFRKAPVHVHRRRVLGQLAV